MSCVILQVRNEEVSYQVQCLYMICGNPYLVTLVLSYYYPQTVQYADLYFSSTRPVPAPAPDRVLYSETVGDTSVSSVGVWSQ